MSEDREAMTPIMEATGNVAIVALYEHKVTIRQRHAISHLMGGTVGEKAIWIDAISSVQLKKPNLITNGYIRFVFSGNLQGSIIASGRDENTVWFKRGKWEDFSRFRDLLEQVMLAQRDGNAGAR